MEKILQSPIHIIATSRGKDDYVMEDKSGKQVPKKVGVGSQQEKDIEYNYTVTFNIDQETHIATVTKDNTHLFEGRYDVLTEKDGSNIIDWANSGEGDMPIEKKKVLSETEDLSSLLEDIKKLFSVKMESGISKDHLYEIVERHHNGKNFMNIKDLSVAKAILEEMKNVE